MGDLEIILPNGNSQMKTTFKDSIHTPQMAFMLILISKLDQAKYKILFHNCFCIIFNPNSKTIAKIPHLEGLYWIANDAKAENESFAAMASGKMSISEAHKRLGHIAHNTITHAVSKGLITGIELDTTSKPVFCDVCAKA